MSDYQEFLARKLVAVQASGIASRSMPSAMKPHQRDATEFALRIGRAGNFLDTGLGKTFCEFEFCQQALEVSNSKALILTPLAVAKQIEREAKKFGYDARVIRSQADAKPGINICNYDRLDKLEPDQFGVVVLDESSILKSFVGSVSRSIREAFRSHRFRLSATATPAPNDHMELGQHSEFLSIMSAVEMLSMFFINDTSTASQEWRLKGHAERAFWNWMASWACMAESPADFGHDASEYSLPELRIIKHQSLAGIKPRIGDGLFIEDLSATNLHEIKRKTSAERAKLAAEIIFGNLQCGNPNTQGADAPNTQQTKMNGSGGGSSADQRNPTASTCENITQPIKTSGECQKKSIGNPETLRGVQDMQPIPNSEKNAKAFQDHETPLRNEMVVSRASSECLAPNIVQCSPNSTASAPSAELIVQENAATNSTLTIVTDPSVCAGSYAPDAILGSDNSAMISSYSVVPSNISNDLDYWIVWCDSNYEQDELERVFGNLCFSVRGSQSADEKEEKYLAWERGERKILVTKPSIFGYGMNMQHCCNMFFVGRSFSYETWYQAVRRCWRFGQKRPVQVHIAVAEGEDQIGRVIDRKSADHAKMKRMMGESMRRALGREARVKTGYEPKHYEEIPAWLMAS